MGERAAQRDWEETHRARQELDRLIEDEQIAEGYVAETPAAVDPGWQGRWAATIVPPEPPATGNPKDAIGDTKPQLHLVPPALSIHAARAMENGARKYGPYNWRENAVRLTVYISAMQRHLAALLDGEDVASDSGVLHLGHVAAGAGIVLDALETGNLIDDRPLPGPAARLIEEFTEKAA